jgi:hypothetical protein
LISIDPKPDPTPSLIEEETQSVDRLALDAVARLDIDRLRHRRRTVPEHVLNVQRDAGCCQILILEGTGLSAEGHICTRQTSPGVMEPGHPWLTKPRPQISSE